jgi:2Fe-2S ferredoxin
MRVEPLGVDIDIRKGESLLEAAWRNGYDWPTLCYAKGTCTACRCEVIEGAHLLSPRTAPEIALLDDLKGRVRRLNPRRVRLACQVTAVGNILIRKAGVQQRPSPSE